MVSVCKEYLNSHSSAAVVNLGCGLDTSFSQISNEKAKGYNIDFANVIEKREELLGRRELEKNIASDLLDYSWFDEIEVNEEQGAVFLLRVFFIILKKKMLRIWL